jgi:hypothetical protein
MTGIMSNEEREGDYSTSFEKRVKIFARSLYPKEEMVSHKLRQNIHDSVIKHLIADPMTIGCIKIQESFFYLLFSKRNPLWYHSGLRK